MDSIASSILLNLFIIPSDCSLKRVILILSMSRIFHIFRNSLDSKFVHCPCGAVKVGQIVQQIPAPQFGPPSQLLDLVWRTRRSTLRSNRRLPKHSCFPSDKGKGPITSMAILSIGPLILYIFICARVALFGFFLDPHFWQARHHLPTSPACSPVVTCSDSFCSLLDSKVSSSRGVVQLFKYVISETSGNNQLQGDLVSCI